MFSTLFNSMDFVWTMIESLSPGFSVMPLTSLTENTSPFCVSGKYVMDFGVPQDDNISAAQPNINRFLIFISYVFINNRVQSYSFSLKNLHVMRKNRIFVTDFTKSRPGVDWI